MSTGQAIVFALNLYLGAGLCVALPFVVLGVGRVEPSARGGSLLFRALIVPGSTLLWPVVLVRWIRALKGGWS